MEDKLEVVVAASQLSEDELGGYLRSKGLYRTHLEQWRKQMLCGLAAPQPAKGKPATAAEKKRIRQLERELRRKDRALAEAAALLVLQKDAAKEQDERRGALSEKFETDLGNIYLDTYRI